MKYIDAEKLIAEINNRLMSVNLEKLGNFGCHRVWAYNDVKDLIASLQQEQPEVDLWKEIHKYFNPHGMKLQFDRSKGNTILKPEQLFNFARHFYELGLNARKEK